MNVNWLATLALVVIQVGFAALLGAFARQAHTLATRAAVFFSAVVFFLSSLSLPLTPLPKAAVLLVSVGLFAFFGRQATSPKWQARLAWLYAGFAMLLILVWSAAQGWLSPLLGLATAAGWAALLAARRGLNPTT